MMFDNCKKCGCSRFECKRCINNEFYRHVDDKIKMKDNMKIIRNRSLISLSIITHNTKKEGDNSNDQ